MVVTTLAVMKDPEETPRGDDHDLHVDVYGTGEPTLLLLHGMGASGMVWKGVVAEAREAFGRIVVPDLPGHGRSPWAEEYTFASMAREVATLVGQIDARHVTVVGHSMGGVVALELATGRHGFLPEAVHGIGIKVDWDPAELATVEQVAARPPRVFPVREQAGEWFLKLAGLSGLVDPGRNASIVDSGITASGEGWRAAQDPRTLMVGIPRVGDLVAAALCPVTLMRGEYDEMVATEQLERYGPCTVLEGAGHNAMVEDPRAVLTVVSGNPG